MPVSTVVILVNYNSGHYLTRAIRSVMATSNADVVVVDNASVDGSIAEAKQEFTHSRVRFIENERNVGFAAANNQVLRELGYDVAVLMNPDCEVYENTLDACVRFLTDNTSSSKLAAVSCRIVNEDGSNQATSRRAFPTPISALSRMLMLHRLPWMARDARINFNFGDHIDEGEEPSRVPAISGAFMVISAEALQDVGLLDEQYFMHCEDLDWCKRCELAGYEIGFLPSVTVLHTKGVGSRARPIGVLWNLHQGMLRFFGKFYRTEYALPTRALVTLGIYTSFVLRAAASWLAHLVKPIRQGPRS